MRRKNYFSWFRKREMMIGASPFFLSDDRTIMMIIFFSSSLVGDAAAEEREMNLRSRFKVIFGWVA